jgi:hypothetical protein
MYLKVRVLLPPGELTQTEAAARDGGQDPWAPGW